MSAKRLDFGIRTAPNNARDNAKNQAVSHSRDTLDLPVVIQNEFQMLDQSAQTPPALERQSLDHEAG